MTWIPYEVTDFAGALKIYAEDAKRKNEEDLKNKLEHSKQLYEADPGRDQLKTFKSLVKFSTTIASALQKKAEKDEAKKAGKDKEHNQLLATLMPDKISEEFGKKVRTHNYEESKIYKDHNAYIDHLSKLEKYKNVPPQLIDHLRDSSAGTILRDKTYLAGIDVANHSVRIRKEIAELNDDEKREFLLTHNTGRKVRDYVTRKAISNLSDTYGFNDKHIASHFITNIKKQAKTFGDGTDINYKIQSLTKDGEKFQLRIDQGVLDTDSDPNALANLTHDRLVELSPLIGDTGKRDWAVGKKQLHMQLAMAVDKGSLSHNELRLIREGLNRGGIPAGKHGDVILTEEQFDDLGKRIDARDTRKVAQHDAEVDGIINSGIAQARDEQLDPKKHQRLLQRLRSLGVSETSEKYKKLENTNLRAQSKTFYDQEKARVDLQLKSGKVTDIKTLNIQNNKLFDETKKILATVKKFRNDNGYDKLNSDKASKDLIQGVTKPTLAQGTLNLESVKGGTLVQNHISQKRDAIIQAVALSETPTKSQVETLLKNELELDGFYVTPGKTDDINFGILTPDHEGNFPQFLALKDAQVELSPTGSDFEYTLKSVKRVHSGIEKLNIRGKTYTEKLVESGRGIDTPEIVALVRNLETGIKNPFPPDTVLKATLFNVETSVLVKGKMQALIDSNNPGDKQIVTAFNLKEWIKKIPHSDVDVRKIIEKGKDPDLLAYHKILGIQNLSDNQLDRLIQLDKTIQTPDTTARRQTSKAQDQRAAKITGQTRKEIVEIFNKQFPGSNFTGRDVRFNNKLKKWELITKSN